MLYIMMMLCIHVGCVDHLCMFHLLTFPIHRVLAGRQSVRDNAEDVIDLLTHFKQGRSDSTPKKIALFLGWSTGVQVGLELVCLYPTLVDKLVLLNGSHGHALQSALQPVFRIPW